MVRTELLVGVLVDPFVRVRGLVAVQALDQVAAGLFHVHASPEKEVACLMTRLQLLDQAEASSAAYLAGVRSHGARLHAPQAQSHGARLHAPSALPAQARLHA